MLAAFLSCPALVFRPVPVLRPVANVQMSLGEGPMSLDDGVPPVKSSSSDALRAEIAAKKQAAGSCVIRETTQTGLPRLRPRISPPIYLSIYLSIYLGRGRRGRAE